MWGRPMEDFGVLWLGTLWVWIVGLIGMGIEIQSILSPPRVGTRRWSVAA